MTEKQNKKQSGIIINSGYYEFLGTDRFDDGEKSFSKDYFDYRKKWEQFPQKKILADFPLHLDIESTNDCNLRCPMCGRNWMKEKIGYIDWNLFTKIIDEASKYRLPSVKFNYRGEPLLHPNIAKMVKYAKEKGVLEVQFNTNGFLLDEKKAKELIDAGLDRIIFSFDGATKETYDKIRRGSNYERVINNIKNLVRLRNERGLKRPLTRVQMVKMAITEKEVEDFIQMWLPITNRVGMLTEVNVFGSEEARNKHFSCPQIWQRLLICWNGETRVCCGDLYGGLPLGNIKKTSIYNLWHSERLNSIRKFHSEGNFNKIPLCARCEHNTPRPDPEIQKLIEKYEKN